MRVAPDESGIGIGEQNDQVAALRFGEIFGSGNVVTVPSLAVAAMEGVLHCLSGEIN